MDLHPLGLVLLAYQWTHRQVSKMKQVIFFYIYLFEIIVKQCADGLQTFCNFVMIFPRSLPDDCRFLTVI